MKKLAMALDVGRSVAKSLEAPLTFTQPQKFFLLLGWTSAPGEMLSLLRPQESCQDLGPAGGERDLFSVGLGLLSQK